MNTCSNCDQLYNAQQGHTCTNGHVLTIISPQKPYIKTNMQKKAEKMVLKFLDRQVLPLNKKLCETYKNAIKGVEVR